MDEKEFIENEVVPAFKEVLKKIFEKHPDLRNELNDETQKHPDKNEIVRDSLFRFLMK